MICIVITISNSVLLCQNSLYALSSNNDIYRIEPVSCSAELVISGSQLNTTANFTDITYELGELYAISASLLYKINLISGQVDYISLGNGIDPIANGLTSNQSGYLYAAGDNLSRIDVVSHELITIGELGYFTQGDIEIVNGDFYIAAASGSTSKLIKVTESPFIVTEVGSMPNNVFGVSSYNSLPNNEIYISKDSSLLTIEINTGSTLISCPNIFSDFPVYGLTHGPNNLSAGDIKDEEIRIFQISGFIKILIESPTTYRATYCIRNSLGQVVEQSVIIEPNTNIDTYKYSNGIYFITVNIGEYVITEKIILD